MIFHLSQWSAAQDLKNTDANMRTPGVRRKYTIINHAARATLGLSITEYCVLDLIYHLASNPTNTQMGWCYAKKETLAVYLDLSRATVFRAIKKGLAINLLEKHPDQPALLRATSMWYEAVMIKDASQKETSSHTMRYTPSHFDTQQRFKMRTNKDTHKENNITVEARISASKEEMLSINKALDQYQLPLLGNNGVTMQWQLEAQRLWQELGLAGEPSRQFFKHIKFAFQRKQQARLAAALSYCKDAVGVADREKLFYWRYANEVSPH